jgi:leucyl-tRNA synthetase
MHLLYSRFWQKALFDLGLVADDEPYTRRMNRGLILGPDGQKMSKSRGNVVDPDEYVQKLGADTVRMYLAFIGPYYETGSYPWNPDAIMGVRRFLERISRLCENLAGKTDNALLTALHGTIQKVTDDVPELKFNTAIAALMSFINAAEKSALARAEYAILLRLIAPFAPHLAEELWRRLGYEASVHAQPWPSADPRLIEETRWRIVIQVDGKVRDALEVNRGASQDEVLKQALELPGIRRWITGKKPEVKAYVPGRLLSLTTAP